MRKYFIIIYLLGVVSALQAQHTLQIEIEGIKKVKGKLAICLITDKSELLSSCSHYSEIAVNAKTLHFTNSNVKPGAYAVTIYHDANSNGELDTNFFRIPKERYGFSNNARSTFGPPSFEKCLVEVKGDTTISIKLK